MEIKIKRVGVVSAKSPVDGEATAANSAADLREFLDGKKPLPARGLLKDLLIGFAQRKTKKLDAKKLVSALTRHLNAHFSKVEGYAKITGSLKVVGDKEYIGLTAHGITSLIQPNREGKITVFDKTGKKIKQVAGTATAFQSLLITQAKKIKDGGVKPNASGKQDNTGGSRTTQRKDVLKQWTEPMVAVIKKVAKEVDVGAGGMGSEDAELISVTEAKNLLAAFKKAGFNCAAVDHPAGSGEYHKIASKLNARNGVLIFSDADYPRKRVIKWYEDQPIARNDAKEAAGGRTTQRKLPKWATDMLAIVNATVPEAAGEGASALGDGLTIVEVTKSKAEQLAEAFQEAGYNVEVQGDPNGGRNKYYDITDKSSDVRGIHMISLSKGPARVRYAVAWSVNTPTSRTAQRKSKH